MWNPRILYDYWVLSKQSPIDNRMRYRAKVLETVRICKQHRGLDHPKETLSLGSFCKEPQKEAALCKYQREEEGRRLRPRNGGFPGKPQKLAQLSI